MPASLAGVKVDLHSPVSGPVWQVVLRSSEVCFLTHAFECSTDDNMSTCSVDEADFQPVQDQLVTLDAADSDAESIDSEQDNALK